MLNIATLKLYLVEELVNQTEIAMKQCSSFSIVANKFPNEDIFCTKYSTMAEYLFIRNVGCAQMYHQNY